VKFLFDKKNEEIKINVSNPKSVVSYERFIDLNNFNNSNDVQKNYELVYSYLKKYPKIEINSTEDDNKNHLSEHENEQNENDTSEDVNNSSEDVNYSSEDVNNSNNLETIPREISNTSSTINGMSSNNNGLVFGGPSTNTNGLAFGNTNGFGSSSINNNEPKFGFGSSSTNNNEPRFGFGSSSTNNNEPKFGFGSSSTNNNEPRFGFGSSSTNNNEPKFGFGGSSTNSNEPRFGFGASPTNNNYFDEEFSMNDRLRAFNILFGNSNGMLLNNSISEAFDLPSSINTNTRRSIFSPPPTNNRCFGQSSTRELKYINFSLDFGVLKMTFVQHNICIFLKEKYK
jgi:hypothetical protein